MLRNTIGSILVLFMMLPFLTGCSSDEKKVENFLSEAQSYFDNEEYQKAVIQLRNAIQIDNTSAEAYNLLAKTHLKLGDAQETFKTYLRLEQIEPDNLDHKIQVASFYLLAQKRIEAERRVDEVLEKEPDNIKALYLHAGTLSAKKEDLQLIEDVYQKILNIDKNQAKAHHILARIYGAKKDFEKEWKKDKNAL